MRFRPCIDIHNGMVKQIVGSSLSDKDSSADENFVADKEAADFARLYKGMGLTGGHVILLNPAISHYYEKTCAQAKAALAAFPGGLQIGGGINPENAAQFLDAGASHVIVTSYVFANADISFEKLEEMKKVVGKEHLVLDVSCRKYEDGYYVCTERWQRRTNYRLTHRCLDQLSESCDEFLVHAVDVEGKCQGIEEPVAELLGTWAEDNPHFHERITYAGGVSAISDVVKLRKLGREHINVTVGSALDLFGGKLSIEEICKACGQ